MFLINFLSNFFLKNELHKLIFSNIYLRQTYPSACIVNNFHKLNINVETIILNLNAIVQFY